MEHNSDFLSDKFFPEESKTIAWELRIRRAARNGLQTTYQHFIDWPNPSNQTPQQYNTALTNLFFYLVRSGESAIGADELIRAGIEDLRDTAVRKDIVDRIAYSHQVMKPRWFEYFLSGEEIEHE